MSPAYNDTIGALLIGNLIGFFTLGIVITQGWAYFARFPHDPVWFKVVAGASIIFCTANMATWTPWLYLWGVTHYGDPTIQAALPFNFMTANAFISATTVYVQLFYAFRCWKLGAQLTRTRTGAIVPVAICIFTTVQFDPHYVDSFWHLIFKQRKTGLRPTTESHIRKIVRNSFQNNALSGASQIFVMAMLAKGPGLWWTVVDSTLAQIYTLAMLASLMSRVTTDDTPSGSKGWSGSGRSGVPGSAAGVVVTVLEEHRLDNAEAWRPTNVRFDNAQRFVHGDTEKGQPEGDLYETELARPPAEGNLPRWD